MDAGALLDLDVTGVAHGGVMVARHEGRVVFVADAIPGERVRVRLTDAGDHATFWRAETLDVLDASADRRPHVQPEADLDRDPSDRPGGADLGHIDPSRQRALKAEVLRDALVRIGRQDPSLAPPVAEVAGGDLGWRTRVSLHVDREGVVGPFAARSHRVVPVASHPLATPAVAAAALALGRERPGRIDLVEPADGRVRVLRRPGRAARARGGEETVVETVAGRPFAVDAGGFWQVHPAAAATLSGVVGEALAGRVDPARRHLDLYGGVGLFAATLAEHGARRVTTVESDPAATRHARANVAGADAVTARVDRFLAAADPRRFDGGVVVLDPPRAGAGRDVVRAVVGLHPSSVVYVACDPVALARDLATFADAGYRAESVRAFDLFPHSHHLECVALLGPQSRPAVE